MTKSFLKPPKLPKNLKILRLPILIFITLLTGFFSGNFYTNQQQNSLPRSGTVTRIIDADNIELDNNRSIRLYAVSCPEKGKKFSDQAIDYLTQTALNQKATLEYQPNYTKESYGRTLAYVFINGQHLNEQLIRQGFCTVTLYSKRAKLIYQDELIQAQDQAKQEKLGRWR